jgi:adenosine deaminase
VTGFASREARAAFIAGLPKAELHLHIEGSLEPEMMFSLAQRNGVSLVFESVEAIRAAYDFSNLQDFLDIYYQGMAVLQAEQDFFDLTTAYLDRASTDGVRQVALLTPILGYRGRRSIANRQAWLRCSIPNSRSCSRFERLHIGCTFSEPRSNCSSSMDFNMV